MTDLEQRIANLPPKKRELLLRQLAKRGAGKAPAVERIPAQPRVDGQENRFVVSFSQLREWMLMQFEPGTAAYNMPGAVGLDGPVNHQMLARTINFLRQRHESLRTRFHADQDEEPVQVVAPYRWQPVPLVDLSGLASDGKRDGQHDAAADEARKLAQRDSETGFDIETGPLFRSGLLRIHAEDHILLYTMHHSISDGWSMSVFFRELTTLYNTFVQGQQPALPELPIQYPDFAVWQRDRLRGEVLEKQLDYWRQQLGSAPPFLDLPLDKPRPPVRTSHSGEVAFQLHNPVPERIKALAKKEGGSLFMVLLALLDVVLYRYSRQDDISVGSYISNRGRAELENLIGFFVNTLVMRLDLGGNPSFRQLVTRAREMTLAAYAHQDVPFEKVLEVAHPERDISRTPLFQVMFMMQNFPQSDVSAGDLSLKPVNLERDKADFDLTFLVMEADDFLHCPLVYNRDLFEKVTMERMAEQLQHLTRVALDAPDTPIDALPLLPAAAQQQLVSTWQSRETPPLQRAHDAISAQARATPGVPAVELGDAQLSYGELQQRAEALAAHLRCLGVGPETLVGVCMARRPALLVALLGVLEAGAGYLPMDPAYPVTRLRLMVEDARVPVLLTQSDQQGMLSEVLNGLKDDGLDVHTVLLDEQGAAQGAAPADIVPEQAHATPQSPAYVIYTSGSTGKPKGVVVEHRSLAHYSDVAGRHYDIQPGDRVLQFASISFDTSAEEIYPCLSRGATLVLRREQMTQSMDGFLAELEALDITVLNLPTAYWHELVIALEQETLTLPPKLRLVVIGGEKALADRTAQWRRHAAAHAERTGTSGIRLVNTYGPTESTIVATRCDILPAPEGTAQVPAWLSPEVPIGRPLPGLDAYLLDDALQPVPPGVPGELCLGGAGLARGYLRRPATTAERFVPDPFHARPGRRLYRTGDLVRQHPDGQLYFLGRVDFQIKLRGFRIEPGEIEAQLRAHERLSGAVVTVWQDPQGARRLVAYVVAHEVVAHGDGATESAPTSSALRAYLKERLPEYMVPALVVSLDAFPLTPSGKIDRRALPAPEADRPDVDTVFVAPSNETERKIAEVWRKVLTLDRIGVHDSFFEIGGDSLLLLQVHRHLKQAVPAAGEMSVIDLFQYPTIAALARNLNRSAQADRQAASAKQRVRDLVGQQKAAQTRQRQALQQRGRIAGLRQGPGRPPGPPGRPGRPGAPGKPGRPGRPGDPKKT